MGKFYEREFSKDDWWIVMPTKVTKRVVYFKDLQRLDKELHTCPIKYFREQFTEMKNET